MIKRPGRRADVVSADGTWHDESEARWEPLLCFELVEERYWRLRLVEQPANRPPASD